jgi:uncharacterized protein YkwD
MVLISSFIFSCSYDSINDNHFINNEITDVKLEYSNIEGDIIALVNDYRVNNNFNALNTINLISLEAIKHTEYMVEVGELSHDNFSERYAKLSENINAKNMSENLAYGHRSAQSAFNSWLASTAHKSIIESPNTTDIGISIMQDDEGRNYFTIIFIER